MFKEKRKHIPAKVRQQVYERCGGHCAYCGCEITMKQMQVDHFIPLELRHFADIIGADADTIDNFLPACRSCNNYKSWLTPERFRLAVTRWHDVLMRDSVTYKNAVRFGQVIPNQHIQEFWFEKNGVHIPAMDWYKEYQAQEYKWNFRETEGDNESEDMRQVQASD